EGLAAAGDPQQHLRRVAALDAGRELIDGARLIAHRLEVARQTERRRQNAIVYAMPPSAMRGFYAILDAPASWLDDPEALQRRARQLLAAQPCCLQLRAKGASARALADAARPLVGLCRAAGVPFCVNDRLDVALSVGADVVHLGQDDLPLVDALRVRAAAGRADLLIGFSTHDRAQALAAARAGASAAALIAAIATASDPTAAGLQIRAAFERAA